MTLGFPKSSRSISQAYYGPGFSAQIAMLRRELVLANEMCVKETLHGEEGMDPLILQVLPDLGEKDFDLLDGPAHGFGEDGHGDAMGNLEEAHHLQRADDLLVSALRHELMGTAIFFSVILVKPASAICS